MRDSQGRGVEAVVVRDLLFYLYVGDIPKGLEERVEELVELAHMYQLDGLVKACRKAILEVIKPYSAVKALVLLEKYPVDEYNVEKEKAIAYIKKNAKAVVKSSDWGLFFSFS